MTGKGVNSKPRQFLVVTFSQMPQDMSTYISLNTTIKEDEKCNL